MTEVVLCARCIMRPAVVDCMNCVGGQEKDALPLCEECNQLIHQGFLQNHSVRSIAIKKSMCKLSDQLQNFKLENDYLQGSLFEMKFIKTDVGEQEEAKILQIHKSVTEAHQSLRTFEDDLAKQVRDAAKEKVLKYVECEEAIQGLIKQHDQISDEVNAALKNEGAISLDIINEMQEKMLMFDAKHFHQEYSSTLLPFTCVVEKPLDFASSIKLKEAPVEPCDPEPPPECKHVQEQPGDHLSLFVESRMDGQSVFWASRDFSPQMTEKLNGMARKIREHLLLNATSGFNVQDGFWCCARYEDNRWYRAKVEKVKPDKKTAIVRWLDYAHNSEVPFSNLKELKQEFQTIPIQAVKCRLFEELEEELPYDVRWNFTGITKDKTLDCTVIKVIQKEGEIPTILVDVILKEDPGVDVKEHLNNKFIELKNKKKDPISCRDFRFTQQAMDDRAKQTTPEPIDKHANVKQTTPESTDKHTLAKLTTEDNTDKHTHAKQMTHDNSEKPKKGSRRASPQPFLEAGLNEIEKPKEKPKKNDKAKKQSEKKRKSLEDIHRNEEKSVSSDVNLTKQLRSGEHAKRISPQPSVWPQRGDPADDLANMNPNAHIFVPRNSPPERRGLEGPRRAFPVPHPDQRSHFLPVDPPSFADVLKSKQRSNHGNPWSHPRSGGDNHCDLQYYHPQVQQGMHDRRPQQQPYRPDELQGPTLNTLGPLIGHGDGFDQLHTPKDVNVQQTEPLVMAERDVCKFVNPECFPQEQSLSRSTLEAFNVGVSLSESGILIGEQDHGAVLKNIGGQLMSKVTPSLDFSSCQSKGRNGGKDRQEPQVSILKKSGRCSPVGTDTSTRIVVGAALDLKIVTELNIDGSFWSVMVRNQKQQAKFLSMANELSLSSDILSPVELHSGKIVAVSPEEGKWCRACVLKVSGDLVQARLVDLGQIVDVSHDQVKKLDSKFMLYSFQAMECSISRPKFREFSSQSRQIFHEHAFDKELKAKVDGVFGCLIYVTLFLNNSNAPDNNLNFKIWSCELEAYNVSQITDRNKDTNQDAAVVAPVDTQVSDTALVSLTNTGAPIIGAPMTGVPITSMADLGAISLLFSETQPSIISTIPSIMPILHGLQSPIGFPLIPFIAASAPYQEVPSSLEDVVEEKDERGEEWPSLIIEEVPGKPINEYQDNNNIDPVVDKVRDRKFRSKTFRSNDSRPHPFYHRKTQCYTCNEFGHMSNNCHKFKRKILPKGRKK